MYKLICPCLCSNCNMYTKMLLILKPVSYQEKSQTNVGKLQLELTTLKQQYNDALGQVASSAELRAQIDVITRKNDVITRENEELMQKESESAKVVAQLMMDIEAVRRGIKTIIMIFCCSFKKSI